MTSDLPYGGENTFSPPTTPSAPNVLPSILPRMIPRPQNSSSDGGKETPPETDIAQIPATSRRIFATEGRHVHGSVVKILLVLMSRGVLSKLFPY